MLLELFEVLRCRLSSPFKKGKETLAFLFFLCITATTFSST